MQVVETFGRHVEAWSNTRPGRARKLLRTGWEAQNLKNRLWPDKRLLPADRELAAIMMDAMPYPVVNQTCVHNRSVGGEERYMMTGGVSKNLGLVKTLEERLGTTLVVSDKAQLCGALGAALFAMDMVQQ